jgi:hypothetical protein
MAQLRVVFRQEYRKHHRSYERDCPKGPARPSASCGEIPVVRPLLPLFSNRVVPGSRSTQPFGPLACSQVCVRWKTWIDEPKCNSNVSEYIVTAPWRAVDKVALRCAWPKGSKHIEVLQPTMTPADVQRRVLLREQADTPFCCSRLWRAKQQNAG